jgi:hypothetical protein
MKLAVGLVTRRKVEWRSAVRWLHSRRMVLLYPFGRRLHGAQIRPGRRDKDESPPTGNRTPYIQSSYTSPFELSS